ncbi:MAG TPA: DNA mismatch repair endonuclease MutL [Terriglobales bacterium]|nr:DNA mismatch repair endonuclease MutL [Terriglobales bacterium]
MGRIHVLPEHVANKIAAGEVVERPASVVKELLENALDAGARRIRVDVEAGGRKLIRIADDGCGMVRDDAMLAFERHATSKIHDADDLLNIATLGFRGEALPSIASVSRMKLETCPREQVGTGDSPVRARAGGSPAPTSESLSGTRIEINGGKLLKVEEAGLPPGTAIEVRDLFFNIPARKKFLKAESTELSHIAQLVTHYALAHPDKHFELHSATNAMLVAAPVASHSERMYQVFGRETLDQMLPLAAELALERVGLPQPPPWVLERMKARGEEWEPPQPGELRARGFVSKPELQKLNRNSLFVFVNGRLIRDKLVQHALTEAYRNMLPSGTYPVVLLFLELPNMEVDCNVHPSKTEVRFRQQTVVHDFVRDSVRAALMKARPVPQFTREISAQPTAGAALTPGARALGAAAQSQAAVLDGEPFLLQPPALPPMSARLAFDGAVEVRANAAAAQAVMPAAHPLAADHCAAVIEEDPAPGDTPLLATLKPLGQLRESFILAVNGEGLWIVDQHVAHERVLFERILKQQAAERVEGQRLLMPMVLELTPAQHAVFSEIADELRRNGFDAEPFGARTVAVKTAPAGVDASDVDRLLHELLDQFQREEQSYSLDQVRGKIAASVACHAAIKVNMPLTQDKMEWLLRELSQTDAPMTCPHGRPVVLRYSLKDIQRAFKRI